MLAHDNFDLLIRGEGALYENFLSARVDDINILPPSRQRKVLQYFNTQVFGSDLEDDREEIERQAAFNREKQRELAGLEQEGSDGGGSQSHEKSEEEAGGNDKNEGSQGDGQVE